MFRARVIYAAWLRGTGGAQRVRRSAVFAHVPDPPDDDRIAPDFIAELIVTDEQATDLAWREVP
jgi:hypothetical protein